MVRAFQVEDAEQVQAHAADAVDGIAVASADHHRARISRRDEMPSEESMPKLRNTDYAEERGRSAIGESRIERLFVKEENQEEIRLSWWPDGKMANRPLDVPESELVALLAQGIADGVLSAQFLPKLIAQAGSAKPSAQTRR
jgi:hypothetical protein